MPKAGFLFAAPNLIPKLMQEFEINFLKKYTPCHENDMNKLVEVLGTTHAELIACSSGQWFVHARA